MPTITFYRQERRDGGIRTGIEIDDETVLSRFDEGRDDRNPALVWYVDVRCHGGSLPRESASARQWLVRNGNAVARILNSLADEIPAGIDASEWPVRKSAKLGRAARIDVSCTAVRRLEAARFSQILRDIASHWTEYVEALSEVEA